MTREDIPRLQHVLGEVTLDADTIVITGLDTRIRNNDPTLSQVVIPVADLERIQKSTDGRDVSVAFFDNDDHSIGYTCHDCQPVEDIDGFLSMLVRLNPQIVIARGPQLT
jgi:hypothetical protein